MPRNGNGKDYESKVHARLTENPVRVPSRQVSDDEEIRDSIALSYIYNGVSDHGAPQNGGIIKDPILNKLYPTFADFEDAIDQTYGVKSLNGDIVRGYHGIGHAIDMTRETPWVLQQFEALSESFKDAYGEALSDKDIQWAKNVKRAAAIAHDMAYLNVDPALSEYNSNIRNYFAKLEPSPENGTAQATLADANQFVNDKLALMVNHVFGYEPGQTINQSNGLNEYASALSFVKKIDAAMREDHREITPEDFEYMTGVTAAIAATVPFRNDKDYAALGERVKGVYREFKLLRTAAEEAGGLEHGVDRRIDLINGLSTLMANQDVLSFSGGLLERNTDVVQAKKIEKESEGNIAKAARRLATLIQGDIVRESHGADKSDYVVAAKEAEKLRYEESPESVKYAKTPGDCTTAQLQFSAWKRSRVARIAAGAMNNGKLFHSVQIGQGASAVSYPPKALTAAMNLAAFDPETKMGVGDTVQVANDAHNVALALLRTLAEEKGKKDEKLQNLTKNLKNIPEMLGTIKDEDKLDLTQHRRNQISLELLGERPHNYTHDVKQSPIAATLVTALKPEELEVLYNLAERSFGMGDNKKVPPDFLNSLTGKSPDVPANGGAKSFREGLNKLREKENGEITAKIDGLINYIDTKISGPAQGSERESAAAR